MRSSSLPQQSLWVTPIWRTHKEELSLGRQQHIKLIRFAVRDLLLIDTYIKHFMSHPTYESPSYQRKMSRELISSEKFPPKPHNCRIHHPADFIDMLTRCPGPAVKVPGLVFCAGQTATGEIKQATVKYFRIARFTRNGR